MGSGEARQLQAQIPTLTRDAGEADVFLGKVAQKARAQFELRRLGIFTEETASSSSANKVPPKKRRRLGSGAPSSPIALSSDDENAQPSQPTRPQRSEALPKGASAPASRQRSKPIGSTVRVVRLAWFTESMARRRVLPLASYTVYEGQRVNYVAAQKQANAPTAVTSQANATPARQSLVDKAEGIMKRAQADAHAAGLSHLPPGKHSHSSPVSYPGKEAGGTGGLSRRRTLQAAPPPALVRKSTSDEDELSRLPPIPAYLHTTYSCQRPSRVHPPNDAFINELRKIRGTRKLVGDRIGIRAYSTAIASLAAYPYVLSTAAEVARLPGCGPKIAELFREFQDTGGHVREADDADADAKLKVLRLFNGIWGVAEATARAFYERGWRDLDDVVEFGWKDLSRVQQVGVKYYDELHQAMTRAQVEAIAARVVDHANRITPGFHMVIAGGYRRGKDLSGDVDIVLSHPDPTATHLLIGRLVLSLEQAGLVTHTLRMQTANSERGQEPVSWKGNASQFSQALAADGRIAAGGSGGTGFDTLDKAMVVWQEPEDKSDDGGSGATKKDDPTGSDSQRVKGKGSGDGDGNGNGNGNSSSTNSTSNSSSSSNSSSTGNNNGRNETKEKTNTNPHRRVDIIISPWKTVGCAVLGWSAGTTFERDLRRYCKYEKKLRFDSSGVRSRVDGSWVDLEDALHDAAPDMLTAERRVFAALDLEWRPPEERCTD